MAALTMIFSRCYACTTSSLPMANATELADAFTPYASWERGTYFLRRMDFLPLFFAFLAAFFMRRLAML